MVWSLLGLLPFRRRPRVSVERIDDAYAGQRLMLRLRIDTPVEVTVVEARVRLRRVLTVYGFSGEDFGLGPRWERKVVAEETCSRIGRLAAGTGHEEICRLPIPGRLPTVLARRIIVAYRVKVRVRFEGARSVRCTLPVPVLSQRGDFQFAEKCALMGGERAKYFLHLDMPLHARPGERICGSARVSPPGEGVPGPVVAELRRREEASRAYRTDRRFVREWTVERKVLAEGVPGPDTARLPVEVTIPGRGPGTVHTDHTAVRWLLYLQLPGLGNDISAAWEINVHTG